MSSVTFWWKPGCATNTRQIRLLEKAGCQVKVCDLLTELWTPPRLEAFFAEMPVSEWFNRSAPRIKSGEVVPVGMAREQALAQMLLDPLLIRRPLIELNGQRMAGFDAQWLLAQGVTLPAGDLPEACSHPAARSGVARCGLSGSGGVS